MSLRPAYDKVFYRDKVEWNLFNIFCEFYQNRGMNSADASKEARKWAFRFAMSDFDQEMINSKQIEEAFRS